MTETILILHNVIVTPHCASAILWLGNMPHTDQVI